MDLNLPFNRGLTMLEEFHINRLLENFIKEEATDENCYCSQCKKHTKSRKKMSIWRLPNILVFHLKRFNF